MKKIFLFCLLFIVNSDISFSQNYNWITPNKTYLKMYLCEDGMYRIGQTDFTNAGISVAAIDPRTVKVFYKGNQIPLYFSGESDGVFGVSDYFDFYGSRNYGGITNTYDQNNTVTYTTNEYYNTYSDTSVYWIDWGGSFGTRYSISSFVSGAVYSNQYFNDALHLERDYYYSQGQNISTSDYGYLNTEKFRGEGWYWSKIGNTQTLSDTFSTSFLYNVPQTSSVKIFGYPVTRNTSVINEHSLVVKINGTTIATILSNDFNKVDTVINFSSSLLSSASVNTVSVTYGYIPNATYPTGYMNLDFIEIQYPKIFKFRNEQLSAITGVVDTTSKLFSVSGFNSGNPVNIYDIANNYKITGISNILDTLKFTGKSSGNFKIINNNITKKPFRIKQKLVPDLTSPSNGADYLVIYNKLFLSQAEQLRAYRQSKDSFRSVKAEIEDIYDIFNFGIENPIAVRNFTIYVYNNWQLPKLGYICLMGRGSLDPKKNLSTSAYSNNYIPVYGYPPSDGYFANVNSGSFFYYDMISIGRLPAYYPSEAQSMVDKIISYESQPVGNWCKTFTYITGGGTAAEQSTHQLKSNTEISTYITPSPISGEAHKIYRSDISGAQTFNIKDSIIHDFDRGVGYVNFRGHAGSHDWEVAMTDPNTLNNGTRLPLILSLTCFTGENSKSDYRGFGERFMYLNNKGAIGFIGTTGWSYSQQGNDFGTFIINSFRTDSTRRMGDLTKYANKRMSQDSISFNVRHTVNCYSLLGDPAAKLKFPVRPEFSITNSDYKVSNEFPVINDNVTISVYPKNFGLYADSCKIRFQLFKNNLLYSVKDTIRRNFAHLDTINYSFVPDSLGNYSLNVILDYGNYFPLEDKSNNVISINLPVKNTSFVALSPVNNSLIQTDSVVFSGLNPLLKTSSNSITVILQLDTSASFNSPALRTFVNKGISGVKTEFRSAVPVKINNRIHFWRTNCVINNDSTGWTQTQNFIYSNLSLKNPESEKNLTTTKIDSKPSISVLKNNSAQYSSADFSNTEFNQNGIELYDYPAEMFIRSYGSNAEEASFFSVGNNNIYIDGGLNAGINMIKVKKLTGSIVEFKNLKMTSSASSDSMVTFLNTFDSTQYLMLLNAAYSGGTVLNASAKTKLKQFGSIYCDSIHLTGYFHTWSLIGYLGANSSQANEEFDRCCSTAFNCTACDHWTESTVSRNVTFRKTSGTVSSIVGPAQSWINFSWTQTINPFSSLAFDVYGIDKNNLQTLLFSNVTTSTNTDLSSVNAYLYPKLNFVAKLSADTIYGKLSPVLNSVKVNYYVPSELTYDINTLDMTSSYIPGDEFKFNYDYKNVGSYDIPGVITNIYKKSLNSSNLILSDTMSSPIVVNDVKKYMNRFIVPDFRDSMKVYVEYKPKGQFNESYSYNNIIEFSMRSSGSMKKSITDVKVYSDGKLLSGNEYVKSKPEVMITIPYSGLSSKTELADTSKLFVKLNDVYIPFISNGIPNPAFVNHEKNNMRSGNEFTMLYYPELPDGVNRLSVIFTDNSDNTDTVSYDVIVSGELVLKDLNNFPNPMRNETNFVFEIGGGDISGNFKIKIYTVSGRLIKTLENPVNIGLNQISWDGKDDDGELVANGTYLYKLTSEGESKLETKTQKLVILR